MSETHFSTDLPLACAVLDVRGRVSECTPAFLSLLGIGEAKEWQAPVLPELLAIAASEAWAETEWTTPQGRLLRFSCLRLRSGRRGHFLLLAEAVMDESLPATALPAENADVLEGEFLAFLEHSPLGIYVLQNGLIRYANPALARLFAYGTPAAMIDRVAARDLLAGDLAEAAAERFFQPAGDGGRFAARRHDGSVLTLEVHAQPFQYAGQPATIGMLVDVSERCRVEAELEKRAFYDPLTGIPNRTLLFDRLEQALVRARRSDEIVAFLLIDLDGFKAINDARGHAVGDQVLRIVATRLAGALRASDSLARLGGDEFAVIAPGLTFGDDVVPVAEKLCATLQTPVVVAGETYPLSLSIGIALYPVVAGDAESLYRAADTAMYQVKQRQRGGYLFVDAAGAACVSSPDGGDASA